MGEAAPELTDSQLSAWNNGSALVRSDWGSIPVDPQLTHSHSSLASRQGKAPITLSEVKLHLRLVEFSLVPILTSHAHNLTCSWAQGHSDETNERCSTSAKICKKYQVPARADHKHKGNH